MVVFSPLSLYTTFIAWQQYNYIYEAFSSTGLLFLGLLYVVWRFFKSMVLATDDKRSVGPAINNYLYDLLITFLLFVCFVMPTVSFHATELNFKPICAAKDASPVTPRNTNTTYDDILSDVIVDEVKVPMVIYFLQKYTSAFVYGLMAKSGCQTNFNELKGQMISAYLPDSLKHELGSFKSQCYDNAKMKFHSHKPEKSVYEEYLKQGGGEGDLNWLGSRVLKNLYYPHIEARDLVEGFKLTDKQKQKYKDLKDSIPDNQGYPSCDKWWDKLQDDVVKSVDSFANGYGFKSALLSVQLKGLIMRNKVPGIASLNEKEIIAKTILNFRSRSLANPGTTNQYNIGSSSSQSILGGSLVNVGNGIRSYTSTPIKREALKQSLPIMQAGLYLFLVVMFIFFAVLSGFKPKVIGSFVVMICFSILINYFWYLIGYIEKSLVGALDESALKTAVENTCLTFYLLAAGVLFGFAGLLGVEGGNAGRDAASAGEQEANTTGRATSSLPIVNKVVK